MFSTSVPFCFDYLDVMLFLNLSGFLGEVNSFLLLTLSIFRIIPLVFLFYTFTIPSICKRKKNEIQYFLFSVFDIFWNNVSQLLFGTRLVWELNVPYNEKILSYFLPFNQMNTTSILSILSPSALHLWLYLSLVEVTQVYDLFLILQMRE